VSPAKVACWVAVREPTPMPVTIEDHSESGPSAARPIWAIWSAMLPS
jgi:hypothetical protein